MKRKSEGVPEETISVSGDVLDSEANSFELKQKFVPIVLPLGILGGELT